jgi:hypothetical protein
MKSIPLLALAALAAAAPSPAQDPNDPGLLDPVVQHLFNRPLRLPGSDQVELPSEQINIVGNVKKKRADTGKSATGKPIKATSTQGPVADLELAVEQLSLAAAAQNIGTMMISAQEIKDVLLGRTSGRIYDGFALLRLNRGGWLPDHIDGEYKAKRLRDLGRTVIGMDGQVHRIWELHVNLLVHADAIESDTCFLLIPPDADFRDQLRIHYTVYSTCRETFSPTTLLHDLDPLGYSRLPSKGYDAAWISLKHNQITKLTVKQGMLGTLRGIQVWGWRADPDRSTFMQPVWERNSVNGDVDRGVNRLRDARGQVMMDQMRSLTFEHIGAAAPEKKLLSVAEAALRGASANDIWAALNSPQKSPLGTYQQWMKSMQHRHQLPQEALDWLALEGIDPRLSGPNRLGKYDAVLVYANHKLYLDARQRDQVVTDMQLNTQPLQNDLQGEQLQLKVINLDDTTHYLQSHDYGPALNQDLANCYNAPWGGQSLEIFTDHPLQGAPKMAELQWRLGWSLRRRLGTVPQFDVFSQRQDLPNLRAYQDENGIGKLGWQYPQQDRIGDWRVIPPSIWLGGRQQRLREDGQVGVVIGTGTTGFGAAKMPSGDLSPLHPLRAVNTDTDGDGIDDALIFPDWMRNPDLQSGDLIPATALWEPFLFLNPNNGSMYLDPQHPELGLWAQNTYAFGQPLAPASNQTITIRRPRSQGQAVWHSDGLFRESTGTPSRTYKADWQ